MKPKKKGRKHLESHVEKAETQEHSKNLPHKSTQGLVSSSLWCGVDIIPN